MTVKGSSMRSEYRCNPSGGCGSRSLGEDRKSGDSDMAVLSLTWRAAEPPLGDRMGRKSAVVAAGERRREARGSSSRWKAALLEMEEQGCDCGAEGRLKCADGGE